MKRNFVYYDTDAVHVPVWDEGEVIPISAAAKCAKFALDKTDHVVIAKTRHQRMEYRAVDLNKVDSLIKSISNARMLRAIVGGELDRIVIGRDLWRNVVDEKLNRDLCFMHHLKIAGTGMPTAIYGLPVQVLRNIDGYLILPKMNCMEI